MSETDVKLHHSAKPAAKPGLGVSKRIARRIRSHYYTKLRYYYLTKLRWHFGAVGIGFSVEPHVHIEDADHLFLGNYVRLLRGSVILPGSGEIKLGDGTIVCRYTVIEAAGGCIHIGSNSLIGDFTNLYGQGGLTIGKNVQIASGCRIVPKTSCFEDKNRPIIDQGYDAFGIIIQDDVWLGVNCVILDGVTIGKGSVVGAGSVVTKSVPCHSVVVGVPARVIRTL